MRLTINDLPQLASWIGFDQMFNELINNQTRANSNWPPYNLKKVDDTNYFLEFAVAGFSEEDIEVTTKENKLTISGGKVKDDTPEENFLHRGIAQRSFENSFTLSNDVVVTSASLVNGMLKISLERIIPEEKKLRTIKIDSVEAIQHDKREFLTEEDAA